MSKLSQFWQELKRRNVIRVITVYAAAAFVILELTDIVAPSLGLPNWTLNFIIILLSGGFIIAVIVSWIFDIRPNEGIIKTTPEAMPREAESNNSPGKWKIASYISFIVIIGFIVFHIVSSKDGSVQYILQEKSVAIIPFIDDSPDKNNEHIINGIMEDLLINLQSIKDLRVPGRTSVEQYRNNPKSIPDIAREMGVSYIVEGSGQRYGNKIRLRVRLIEGANNTQLWNASYDEVIKEPEDIFRIQSQIARAVARELQAVITPEEKEILERVHTTSLTAYDYYHRGREEFWKNDAYFSDKEGLEYAKAFFHRALSYDSLFAPAFAELASVYYAKFNLSGHLEQVFLDSIRHFSQIALAIDDKLASAYSLRGTYFYINLEFDRAIQDFNRAMELNPNDYRVYLNLGNVRSLNNLGEAIYFYQKAAAFLSGSELANVLSQLSEMYGFAGFYEQGDSLAREAYKLHGDSALFLKDLARIDFQMWDHAGGLEHLLKIISSDIIPNEEISLRIAWHYMHLNQMDSALIYVYRWMEDAQKSSYFSQNMMHRVGYILEQNGFREKANDFFKRQIEYCNKLNEFNQIRSYSGWTYYDLAAIYAYRSDKVKAYENLYKFIQEGSGSWYGMTALFNNDPFFNGIRGETEFQQIIKNSEKKCLAEYDKVRSFLEDNSML